MQTDAVECATQALEKYNIEKDMPLSSRKNSTKNTAQPGTASLAATLAVMLPTRPSTLSISIWDKSPSFCSNLDRPTSKSAKQRSHHISTVVFRSKLTSSFSV